MSLVVGFTQISPRTNIWGLIGVKTISKETQFKYVHLILDELWIAICLICYKYGNLSLEYDWQSKRNILFFSLGTQLWGKANKDWIICSKGKYQSPINIDPTSLVHDPHLTQLSTNHNKVRTHIITEKPVTYWYFWIMFVLGYGI